MNFTDETRAPLEFSKPRAKQKIIGCPTCKTARSVSVDCIGLICSKCNKYFSIKDALTEEECESVMNQNRPINTDYTKIKADTEKKAYEYRDKINAKRAAGEVRSHEPGLKPRNW